jgi:hypothetical protein
MNDPLGVSTRGRLTAPCQIVQASEVDGLLFVDLVTTGSSNRTDGSVPAGTILALGLRRNLADADNTRLDRLLRKWIDEATKVRLEARRRPAAISYVLRSDHDQFAVIVD